MPKSLNPTCQCTHGATLTAPALAPGPRRAVTLQQAAGPRSHLCRWMRASLATLCLAGAAASAWAQPQLDDGPQTCPHGTATVRGATPADFTDICAGVAKALEFLDRHGVQATEPVVFVVTPTLPEEAGPTAVGCYIERRHQVYVVPYAAFRRNRTWFGVPITREMYRLLAAHESAHAVAACHFQIPTPTIQAKEYIAYVTTFSVMPPAVRKQALRTIQSEGFSSLDRFTPLLYLFDPMRFGAEAYRHFAAAPDQTGIVRGILEGQLLAD